MSAVPQLYQLKARLLGISPMGIAHRLGRAFNRVAGTVGRAYRQAGARRTRRVCRRHPGQDADRREDRQGPYRAALELRPLREAMVRTGAALCVVSVQRGSVGGAALRPSSGPKGHRACRRIHRLQQPVRRRPRQGTSLHGPCPPQVRGRLRARWIDHREGRHRANCQALCHR